MASFWSRLFDGNRLPAPASRISKCRELPSGQLVSTFNGHIRQLTRSHLSWVGDATMNLAFPLFVDAQRTMTFPDDNTSIQVAARRFGSWMLPRGAYFSVCKDATGVDGGTLAEELNAYRAPRTDCVIHVQNGSDTSREPFENLKIPTALLSDMPNWIVVTVYPAIALRREIFKSGSMFAGPSAEVIGLLEDDTAAVVVFRPPVKREEISKVVDLRFPEIRESFFKTFSSQSKCGSFRRVGASGARSFFDMVPELLDPNLGGRPLDACGGPDGLTGAIGGVLAQQGANGVIYPSARCDWSAEFHRGELRSFYGWNFVDYRQWPLHATDSVFTLFNGGPWKPIGSQQFELGEGDGATESRGSIHARGLTKLNRSGLVELVNSPREAIETKPPKNMVVIFGNKDSGGVWATSR